MKALIFIASNLLGFYIVSATNAYGLEATQQPNNESSSYFHLSISPQTTAKKPGYFACFVDINPNSPTLKKWTPELKSTQVILVNYATNVRGFNGLGILNTYAGYLIGYPSTPKSTDYTNGHYFEAFHDPDLKEKEGFINAFVSWAGYKIHCKTLTLTPTEQHDKSIVRTYDGKTYHMVLAGSDYN